MSNSSSFSKATIKIQIVTTFPDVRLQKVSAFGDFEVYLGWYTGIAKKLSTNSEIVKFNNKVIFEYNLQNVDNKNNRLLINLQTIGMFFLTNTLEFYLPSLIGDKGYGKESEDS